MEYRLYQFEWERIGYESYPFILRDSAVIKECVVIGDSSKSNN